MSAPFTRYFVLVEPSMGETVTKPGALFREIWDGTNHHLDILFGPNEWVDRPNLLGYTMGDAGAEQISVKAAARLEAEFPWPGARTLQR